MTCEHLICGSCAGPVAEGRCTACRATRSQLHSHPPVLTAQVITLVAMITALLTLVAYLR